MRKMERRGLKGWGGRGERAVRKEEMGSRVGGYEGGGRVRV